MVKYTRKKRKGKSPKELNMKLSQLNQNEKSIKELINDKLMISLRQFEKETGVTRQTVYNILNGKGNPTVLTVKKICAYFGVNYKDYI